MIRLFAELSGHYRATIPGVGDPGYTWRTIPQKKPSMRQHIKHDVDRQRIRDLLRIKPEVLPVIPLAFPAVAVVGVVQDHRHETTLRVKKHAVLDLRAGLFQTHADVGHLHLLRDVEYTPVKGVLDRQFLELTIGEDLAERALDSQPLLFAP